MNWIIFPSRRCGSQRVGRKGIEIARRCRDSGAWPRALWTIVVFYAASQLSYADPGDLDRSFGDQGIVHLDGIMSPPIRDAAVQADGKIIVVGSGPVARLLPSGELDPTFGVGGVVTGIDGAKVAIQPDGKVIVAGSAVQRLNSDGSFDLTFGAGGAAPLPFYDWATSNIRIQPDGRILVAFRDRLVRLQTNGVLDATFGNAGVATFNLRGSATLYLYFREICLQNDGKILVAAGGYTDDGHSISNALIRSTSSGALDAGFNGKGWIEFTDDFSTPDFGTPSVAVQKDGKIAAAFVHSKVVGTSEDWQRHDVLRVVRLTQNGSLDLAFNRSGGVDVLDVYNGEINVGDDGYPRILLQNDGKLIVSASTYGPWSNLERYKTALQLVRVNQNGVLDPTFNMMECAEFLSLDPNDEVGPGFVCGLQQDGKIILFGGRYRSRVVARFAGGASAGLGKFSSPMYVTSEASTYRTITVNRSQTTKGTMIVHYECGPDGTATPDLDYVPVHGSLTFGPGVKSRTFRVPLSPDSILDGGEYMRLRLYSDPGLRLISSSVLNLREKTLVLYPARLTPGKRVSVSGAFDPTQSLFVRFRDFKDNDIPVLASDVTTKSAKVRVPVFADSTTLMPGATSLAVQTEQGDAVRGPVVNVPVAAPSSTGYPPGSFALEFLRVQQEVLQSAEQSWLAIENQSQGAVDTQELRDILSGLRARLQSWEPYLQALVEGSVESLDLGRVGTDPMMLDAEALTIIDKMLIAAVFEGSYKPPVTAQIAAVPNAAASAASKPNSIEEFRHKLDPKTQKNNSAVFELAKKVQEYTNTGLGCAKGWAEQYLGNPIEVVSNRMRNFTASHYFGAVLHSSIVAQLASAEVEPFVRNEKSRPITASDLERPLESLVAGQKQCFQEENRRLTRVWELLNGHGWSGSYFSFSNFIEEDFDASWERAIELLDVAASNTRSLFRKVLANASTIFDNRPRPVVSLQPSVTCIEPPVARTSRTVLISLSLDRPFDLPVTVTYAPRYTTDPDATYLRDFHISAPFKRVIPAFKREATIAVLVHADSVFERPEAFYIDLTGATNGILGNRTCAGVIHDAKLTWHFTAQATIAGGDYSLPTQSFTLPRTGGTKVLTYPDNIKVTLKVTGTQQVTLTGTGFGSGEGITCSGKATGSAPIINLDSSSVSESYRAQGELSGRLTCTDLPPEDSEIFGVFTLESYPD